MVFRLLEKNRTVLFATLIALILIIAGLIIPTFLPDERSGFEDAPFFLRDITWVKPLIAILFIGMGVLSWLWIVIIQNYFLGKEKKDYVY